MRDTVTCNGGRSALALAAVLAALGVACAVMPSTSAAAAQADQTGGDYRPSDWGEASDAAPSAELPSLTNDVGRTEGHAGSQLSLGLGFLALGLGGLVCGLAATLARRLGSRSASRLANAGYRLAKSARS